MFYTWYVLSGIQQQLNVEDYSPMLLEILELWSPPSTPDQEMDGHTLHQNMSSIQTFQTQWKMSLFPILAGWKNPSLSWTSFFCHTLLWGSQTYNCHIIQKWIDVVQMNSLYLSNAISELNWSFLPFLSTFLPIFATK